MAAIQLWFLVSVCLPQSPRTRATIPCATVSLLCIITLFVLSYLEHTRSIRPSTILATYLLISLLGDIVRARTLWSIHDNRRAAIALTASVAWKTVVLVLESIEKRRLLREGYQESSPEATGNIWNVRLFYWLNPLLLDGFSGEMGLGRLYPNDEGLLPEPELPILSARWSKVD